MRRKGLSKQSLEIIDSITDSLREMEFKIGPPYVACSEELGFVVQQYTHGNDNAPDEFYDLVKLMRQAIDREDVQADLEMAIKKLKSLLSYAEKTLNAPPI